MIARGMAMATLVLAAAVPAMAQAQEVSQVDLGKPERPLPGAGEAMVVLRPHASSMVGDNRIHLYRIDPATGAPLRDARGRPAGARITYSYSLFGGKKGEKALRVAILPAGSYVLAGRTFNGSFTDSFCFGAPRFTLAAGEVAYLGDFEMIALRKMPDGERRNAMLYSAAPEEARAALAAAYPDIAPRLAPWQPTNGATFACEGDEFTAYAVPGAPAGN